MSLLAPPDVTAPYAPRRLSQSTFVEVRGLRLLVRSWGDRDAPPIVLLHGGRDASATFQFLVDAFDQDWHIIAPDWRGHGKSAWAPGGYWFQDYLADLEGLLDQLSLYEPVPLIGHSLGGNVACTYAGVRPERVSHLISLDGFGLPDRDAREAPAHLRHWLDKLHAGPGSRKPYRSIAEMAMRLQAQNPRLPTNKALFLAEQLSQSLPEGGFAWDFDPAHRLPLASLYRQAEVAACLAQIRAPTLWIGSGSTFPPRLAIEPGGIEARLALIPGAGFAQVAGTGHNLHHDDPAAVAHLIERFLSDEIRWDGPLRPRS